MSATIMTSQSVLAIGISTVNVTITCNSFAQWTSAAGASIDTLTCAYLNPGKPMFPVNICRPFSNYTYKHSVHPWPSGNDNLFNSFNACQRSLYVFENIVTEDYLAACTQCANLSPTQPPSLSANEEAGMLVLDHTFDSLSDCRIVAITCTGASVCF